MLCHFFTYIPTVFLPKKNLKKNKQPNCRLVKCQVMFSFLFCFRPHFFSYLRSYNFYFVEIIKQLLELYITIYVKLKISHKFNNAFKANDGKKTTAAATITNNTTAGV